MVMRGHVEEDLLTSLIFCLYYETFFRLDKPATLSVKDRVALLIPHVGSLISLSKHASHVFKFWWHLSRRQLISEILHVFIRESLKAWGSHCLILRYSRSLTSWTIVICIGVTVLVAVALVGKVKGTVGVLLSTWRHAHTILSILGGLS